MKETRRIIGLKATLIIAAAVSIFSASIIGYSYFYLFDPLRNNIMDSRVKMAELAANSIAILIEQQAELVKTRASAEALKDAMAQASDDVRQKAFSASDTRVSMGDAVLDESTGRWSFPMAVAIGGGNDAPAVAYRTSVAISSFSKPLEDMELGKGVRSALIDGRGYLVFYPGVKPFSNKFCEYEELKRLLNNKKGWSVIDTVYMASGKTAVAFSAVKHPSVSIMGAGLYVVVSEDSRELFRPLNILTARMGQVSFILIIAVLVFAGLAFKRMFSKPMKALIEGMKFIGDGILDRRVAIKTGDDMEELAAALNGMAESLKHMTTSVKTLEQEKAARTITERRLERAGTGFLSLMLTLRAGLIDMTKAIEAGWQEADRARDEKLKKALEPLRLRADGLIRDMEKDIYASRLETGALEFRIELKDLRDILKGSIFVFEPKVRAKGLGLKLDIPKSALTLAVDKDRIREVFDILIENSLLATEKGSISVSVRELKDEVEISVSDTGEGIRRESIGNVFERFGGFSRVRSQEGSVPGPDMFIAKLIIEKHNGRIKVESDPGGWTKFVFTLPKIGAVPEAPISH